MRQILIVLVMALGACSAPEPPPAVQPVAEGRPETQSIRATEAVGYAGDSVADKVDSALDQNERRKADIDAQIDADSGGAETPPAQ